MLSDKKQSDHDMKYSKRIIVIISGIVFNVVSMNVLFCSQRPPLAQIAFPVLTPKPMWYNSSSQHVSTVDTLQQEQERVELQEQLLQKYSANDAEVIKYWTSAAVVSRIKDPQSSFITPKSNIIKYLVEFDVSMKRNKAARKAILFGRECDGIRQNNLLDLQQKEQLTAYMHAHKESIKNELWLAHMYDAKNDIHKRIELHKSGTACEESYYAWPFIREIAGIKGFVYSGK